MCAATSDRVLCSKGASAGTGVGWARLVIKAFVVALCGMLLGALHMDTHTHAPRVTVTHTHALRATFSLGTLAPPRVRGQARWRLGFVSLDYLKLFLRKQEGL